MAIRFCIPDLTTGANDGTSETDAWKTVADCATNVAAGDHVYMKTPADGSRADLSRLGVDGSGSRQDFNIASTDSSGPTVFEGYKTTPGDQGMFRIGGHHRFRGDNQHYLYWDVDNGGGNQVPMQIQADGIFLYRCVINSDYELGGSTVDLSDSTMLECAVYGSSNNLSSAVIRVNSRPVSIINCYIELQDTSHGAVTNGQAIDMASDRSNATVTGCIIVNRHDAADGIGIRVNQGVNPRGYTFINNTFLNWSIAIHDEQGIDVSALTDGARLALENVFYNCEQGFRQSQATFDGPTGIMIRNAYGNITTSQRTLPGLTHDEITLTATPFKSFGEGETLADSSLQASPVSYIQQAIGLNNALGGGALIKGSLLGGAGYAAGLSGAFTGGTGPINSFRSAGAIQPNPFPESSNVF